MVSKNDMHLLQQASTTLAKFAQTHCGPASQISEQTRKGIFGIGSHQVIVEEICWAVTIDYMIEYNPDGTVDVCPCAILDLKQIPTANLWVLLQDSEHYSVRIMTEIKIPGTSKSGLFTFREDIIDAQTDILHRLLNSFIQQGFLTQESNRLRIIRPHHP